MTSLLPFLRKACCRLILLASLPMPSTTFAQRTDWPATEILPVVLRGTRPDEWPELRRRIEARLRIYLGERPPSAGDQEVKFEEISRDQVSGLTRIRYRYHVTDDAWSEAFLLLPPDFKEGGRRAAVMVIHGTSDLGKLQTMSEPELPHRHYAIELARRGFITFSHDLFGYGPGFDSVNRWGYFEDFDKQYPQWS